MTVSEISEPSLVIHLLGQFDVRLNGAPLRPLRTHKSRWLLALLTLRYPAEVERAWLAGVLWPDSLEERALYNLRRSLSDLRNALGPEKWRLSRASSRTVRLNLSGVGADVVLFDAAIQSGEISVLERAVALYRGPFLEGCEEEWVFQERIPREEAFTAALEILGAYMIHQSDYAPALRYLRRAVLREPLRETAVRLLMLALAQSGDYAAAVQVYRDLRLQLRRDFLHASVDPDIETQLLYKRLRQEARQRSETIALPSVAKQERARPVASHSSLLHNLAEGDRVFVGRLQERKDLVHKVCERNERMVTITGIGGIGKSRLAFEFALAVRERFHDGVWWVAVENLVSRQEIVATICEVLALSVLPEDAEQTLKDYLSSRNMLLVFDCFERLTDQASFLDDILRLAPDLYCLVTSRVPLGMQREYEYPLGPMPAISEQAKQPSDSMQLFAESARYVVNDFTIDASNYRIIDELCNVLEGVPLSIVIAASRLRSLSPRDLLRQVKRSRLSTLRLPGRSGRHATLRGVIDDSLVLIPNLLRKFLCGLMVFEGSFDLEAIEYIWGDERATEVLDGIEQLSMYSLLVHLPGDDSMRYRVLDSIRECLQDREDSVKGQDNYAVYQWRHAQYFANFALKMDLLIQEGSWGEAKTRLMRELGNLRAAVRYALAQHDEVLICQLTDGLAMFYQEAGLWQEFETLTAIGNQALKTAGAHHALARLLGIQGAFAQRRGRETEAQQFWERRWKLCEQLGDQRACADALLDLAGLARAQKEFASANDLATRALEIANRIGNPGLAAYAHTRQAEIAMAEGNLKLARKREERAQELLRDTLIRDERVEMYAYLTLGRVYSKLEDYTLAESALTTSMRIASEENRPYWIGLVLIDLSETYALQKRLRDAAVAYLAAAQLHQELGSRFSEQARTAWLTFSMNLPADLKPFLDDIQGCHWRELTLRIVQLS